VVGSMTMGPGAFPTGMVARGPTAHKAPGVSATNSKARTQNRDLRVGVGMTRTFLKTQASYQLSTRDDNVRSAGSFFLASKAAAILPRFARS
jgi:hypothetical protein